MPYPQRAPRRPARTNVRPAQRRTSVRPANKKNLKKTTNKGAYKKGAKANFQKRRVPFVETKQQSDVMVALKAGITDDTTKDTIRNPTLPFTIENRDAAANPEELTIFPIHAYMNMNKGLEGSDMIGQKIYSRYLKAKVEIELPSGTNPIRHPCDIYLIHGWITQPLGKTLHTTPTNLQVTRSDVQNHILANLQQYFNQREDKLIPVPKVTSNIKFEGYRKIKPKMNAQLGVQPLALSTGVNNTQTYQGAMPLINMNCSWRTKRKVQYSLGATSSSVNNLEHNYVNYGWIPFLAVYNPTAGTFLDTNVYPPANPGGAAVDPKLKIRYNTTHYFQDS